MGVYKVGKTWYVDYYYDGRRVRKAIGTKKEAEMALTAIKADILRGEYRFKRERSIKFEDFADEYLRYAKANKKSWKSDRVLLNRLVPFFRGKKLSKITPRLIEEYKLKRISECKQRNKNKKVKPSSVNRELSCLKFMFSLAERWKLVNDNPVKEVRLFKEQKIAMKILTEDEAEKLIHNSCEHLKPIIILALHTGMRRGEIFKLKWNDIDFNKHFIYVKETKSNVMRKVPMNSFVADTLKRIKREGDYVFYNPKTKDHITDVKKAFRAACRRAGIKDLRFHDLRHSAATSMVTGGIDLVTVAEILGHSDIKTTMRYAHPTPENKRKTVDILARVYGPKEKKIDTIWSYREDKKDITSSLQKN